MSISRRFSFAARGLYFHHAVHGFGLVVHTKQYKLTGSAIHPVCVDAKIFRIEYGQDPLIVILCAKMLREPSADPGRGGIASVFATCIAAPIWLCAAISMEGPYRL